MVFISCELSTGAGALLYERFSSRVVLCSRLQNAADVTTIFFYELPHQEDGRWFLSASRFGFFFAVVACFVACL